MAAPMAMATGVSLLDDLVPSAQAPRSAPSQASHRPSPLPGEYVSEFIIIYSSIIKTT